MRIEIDQRLLKSLLVLASTVEARDVYTGGHLWRVAQFATLLGKKAGLSNGELFRLVLGGLLHDIGKIGIPDSILMKPGPLTDEEFAVMRTHPLIGLDLVREHPLGDLVADVVAHHHQWVDGRGYPDDEDTESPSLFSRIIGVADVYDALTSARPYRGALAPDKAFEILRENRGLQFEESLVNHLGDLDREGALSAVVGHSYVGRALVDCPSCGPVLVLAPAAASGDFLCCRGCKGRFQLASAGETFLAEFSGSMGTPEELRIVPEMEPIEDLLAIAPAAITI